MCESCEALHEPRLGTQAAVCVKRIAPEILVVACA